MNTPTLKARRPRPHGLAGARTSRLVRLRLTLVAVFALCLIPVSCTDRERSSPVAKTPFNELWNVVVADAPLVVIPDRAWRIEADRWTIRGEASLVCQTRERLDGPLFLGFVLDGPIPDLETYWDGELLEGVGEVGRDVFTVRIEPDRQGVGTHVLTFRLAEGIDSASFPDLGFRYHDVNHGFPKDESLRRGYLSDLVLMGVTGSEGLDMLGGFVLDGPRETRVSVDAGGKLSAVLHNTSARNATFEVGDDRGRLDSWSVAPHERRPVRVELPDDATELTFRAEGERSGFFVVGAPLLHSIRPEARPPVVIITLDTTRRDAIGVYGGNAGTTPNLDSIARGATVYTRAYTTAPWTLPAHASLFTGLYASHHGAGVSVNVLAARHHTLAEHFRDIGYDTAGFPGGLLSNYKYGVGQGFLTYRQPEGFETRDAALTDHAIKRLRDRNSDELFLFVNYFGPHFPYDARGELMRGPGSRPLANRGDSEEAEKVLNGDGEVWERLASGEISASESLREAIRREYLAEVRSTDAEVGRLVEALQFEGLYDEALIVIVADHGELLGEGGYYSHSVRLHDELVHVPLIVKWPNQQRGERIADLVSIVDVFPTVLELVGIDAPPSDGISLRGERDEERRRRRSVVIEEHDRAFHPLFPHSRMGRDSYRVQAPDAWLLASDSKRTCYRADGERWVEISCSSRESASIPPLPEIVRKGMSTQNTSR
ncbi:MAG: sulfatase, partial [Acidobacteria bacterium]|nr:sulfatase [Acidobacteriota bacterium]